MGMTVGPTVTRYELELGPGREGGQGDQPAARHRLRHGRRRRADPGARSPGRSAIGVEVPNQQRQLVALGDILTSAEAHAATHPLEVALGRDIAGRPVLENLATMPHILIAGATGAGKSSCINSLITSVLLRATPDQVRLILVDPKRVELGQYNGLPHLLTGVVTNPKKAANALSWAVHEMERRYDLLAEVGVRDITGYNAAYDRGELDESPRRSARSRALRPPALHPGRGRRAQRPDDGGGPRRRGVHLPHRPDGPGRRHPPGDRHPAPVGRRHHRGHQGQHPVPAGVRGVVAGRQPGHPRPARSRAADRPGRHAAARRRRPAWPGASRGRGWARTRSARWSPTGAASPSRGTSRASRAATTGRAGSARGGDDDDDELLEQAKELVVRSQLGLDLDAAAQAAGRLRPGRAADGPARAAGRGRALGGLEGPGRAHDRRGARGRHRRARATVGATPPELGLPTTTDARADRFPRPLPSDRCERAPRPLGQPGPGLRQPWPWPWRATSRCPSSRPPGWRCAPPAAGRTSRRTPRIWRPGWPSRSPATTDFVVEVHSDIPVGRGLGSSAALAVAAAAAAGAADPFRYGVAVDGHPENAAASAFGGLVVATTVDGRPVSGAWRSTPACASSSSSPTVQLPTAGGPGASAGHRGARRRGLQPGPDGPADRRPGRPRLLMPEAGDDRLHQDARAALFPEAPALLAGLARPGRLTSCWSGAGPSLLAVCASDAAAGVVAGRRAAAGRPSSGRPGPPPGRRLGGRHRLGVPG